MIVEDVAADLIEDGESHDFPPPWTFDGTRRVYDNGQPVAWQARAVDMTGEEGGKVPLMVGTGDTPMLAVIDLVEKLS